VPAAECQFFTSAFRPDQAKSFLANSGAEAVENAVKIARVATQRQAIICFEHGFHGRTYMAMTLTSKFKPYKYGFAPFNPEVYRAPFPDAYRWPGSSEPSVVAEGCFQEFLKVAQQQLAPTQIAAVIFEPVLGEGGFMPMPPEFLKKLSQFCAEHKIVLITDESKAALAEPARSTPANNSALLPTCSSPPKVSAQVSPSLA